MVPLPFPREEYLDRLKRVRNDMAARQLDLLIVTDVANQHYITAYDGWSFYTPQVVVVPMEGEPIFIGRSVDAVGGRLTAWMKPENVVGYPEDHVQTAARHPMDWMGKFIADKGWGKARIGIETETYYYSPKAHARLTAALPNAAFVDADLLVSWIRSVKSPAEIEHMRKAAVLVDRATLKAFEVIEPGVRECDAAAAIQSVQTAGSQDFAGDFTAIPPIIMAGENAAAPHLMWSDRRYTPGETISLELAGAHRHYTASLARTLQLGSKPKRIAEAEAAVLEGMEAVLAKMAPGVTAQDVETAWRMVIARHGFKKESRIGYSIGIGFPPDWGEHTISLRQGDMTVLQPGNTMHAIMGMWMEGWGIEISETVLVTEQGCEPLGKLPREIHHKP